MQVTYYGHSCFGVEAGGKILLFDPFISSNPLAKAINVAEIKADYIFLTHAHHDHVEDAYNIAKRTGAVLISNYEIYLHYSKLGLTKFHPMSAGGGCSQGNFRVKCVNAIHASSFDDGTYGGSPVGFTVSSEQGSFYHAGDTALTYDMKLIGEEFNLNFAMLPVGDNFTMGASDAIKASDFIKCNNIVAMHYNTFDLIKVDTQAVTQSFEKSGKKITFMEIGETKDF